MFIVGFLSFLVEWLNDRRRRPTFLALILRHRTDFDGFGPWHYLRPTQHPIIFGQDAVDVLAELSGDLLFVSRPLRDVGLDLNGEGDGFHLSFIVLEGEVVPRMMLEDERPQFAVSFSTNPRPI
jgi:hypothetical protein